MLLHLHLIVFEHVANLFTAPLVVTSRLNVAALYHFTDFAPIALRLVNTLDKAGVHLLSNVVNRLSILAHLADQHR